jgi:P-type Ca2+ transporter type 2C
MKSDYYKSTINEVQKQLNTSIELGLSADLAEQLLIQYGPNELVEKGIKNPWRILWEQFTATMVLILIIAAVISIFLGEIRDSIAIMVIVILNGLLGFQQEYKAEQAMAALKKMSVPTVKIRRDGHVKEISARQLVPGDIIILEAGDLVPADSRLVETVNFRVQESALTGESEPVDKDASFISSEDIPLGDRINMAYLGTVVTYGRSLAAVVSTGMQTELGNIAEMIQAATQEPTPLQRRLDQLGKGLAVAALVLVSIVFFLGLLRGEDLRLMFMTAISMAVAAVPEGLPAVVTITLALGAQRMLKRRALIRKLPAVETLGSVTVICSDKTGTLTENRMTVTVLDVAGYSVNLIDDLGQVVTQGFESADHSSLKEKVNEMKEKPALILLLTGAALSNDAILDRGNGGYETIGDPTESALLVAAAQIGLIKNELEGVFQRTAEVPFDSVRKRMSTIHKIPEVHTRMPKMFEGVWNRGDVFGNASYIEFTKGAVDSLLQVSGSVWVNDHRERLDDRWVERISKANDQLAQNGMRVLGVAYRLMEELPEDLSEEQIERDLVFVGMLGLIDPARPEVREAVHKCKTAGIRPVMVTGDHPLTALYIAKELGISTGENILSGRQISEMSTEKLEEVVEKVDVFARVSPENKFNIVQAMQNRGHIAAMTGDGINDAPALRKADIGVAMGITGTDVAKEAADMILLDDNFATIVAAVEEGRTIYDNVRKFIKYTMTSNSGEIWVMLFAPFLGMPLPLLPLQILWINLVTDGLPGLAFAVEPSERDIMNRKPFHPRENIFGRGMGRHIIWVGVLMGMVSLFLGYFVWVLDDIHWQTMVFTTLTLSQMGHAMAIRSTRESLFSIGIFTNKALIGAVLLTFILQMVVVYMPFFQEIFDTKSLSFPHLILCLVLSSVVFWGVEAEKWVVRRRGLPG